MWRLLALSHDQVKQPREWILSARSGSEMRRVAVGDECKSGRGCIATPGANRAVTGTDAEDQ
jgi:hypothetical protein